MLRKHSFQRGFTLLELLVVISIIMLIAGFMLPVLSRVREASYRAKARETVSQIYTAWTVYYADNRTFPAVNITQMDQIGCAYVNTNLEGNSSVMAMEITIKESQEGLKDHWGGIFQVRLDNGMSGDAKAYDGQVTVPSVNGNVTIQRPVAVWSKGKNNGLNGTVDDPGDDIRSW